MNENIAILSGVQNLETEISNRIKQYRSEKIEVQIKSEIAVKELFSNIIPYLKAVDDDNLYPTAGDGSKKLIAYALFDIIATNIKESKINLFFVEEPENHLHKSIQVALSKILFNNDGYEYLFVTTHSSYILHEMDDVNLIRLYKDCRNECFAHSVVYKLPTQYIKRMKPELDSKRFGHAKWSGFIKAYPKIYEWKLIEDGGSSQNFMYKLKD